VSSELFINWNS